MAAKYTLPQLPYAYDALEPHISEQIMKLHHSKHHQAYVNNLNVALQNQHTASSNGDVVEQIYLQEAIKFNAGGHINHTLFWSNLIPASSPKTNVASSTKISAALQERWGSTEAFIEKFNAVLLGIKGSGWGWLVQDVESGHLEIVTTKDQDITPKGKKPLFGIDMWEHAYYLQYFNDKASYVKGVWKIINWETVEERLVQKPDEVYGSLKNLKAAM